MPSIAQKWQARRKVARSRRELQRAIDTAGSPTMRNELIAIAARQHGDILR